MKVFKSKYKFVKKHPTKEETHPRYIRSIRRAPRGRMDKNKPAPPTSKSPIWQCNLSINLHQGTSMDQRGRAHMKEFFSAWTICSTSSKYLLFLSCQIIQNKHKVTNSTPSSTFSPWNSHSNPIKSFSLKKDTSKLY